MELAAARGVAPTAPAAGTATQRAVQATHRASWCLPPSYMVSARQGRRRAAGRRCVPPVAAAASSESSGSSNGAPNGMRRPTLVQQAAAQLGTLDPAGGSADGGGGAAAAEPPRNWTKFVAETLLPTQQGKFRLRGYRHTVSQGVQVVELADRQPPGTRRGLAWCRHLRNTAFAARLHQCSAPATCWTWLSTHLLRRGLLFVAAPAFEMVTGRAERCLPRPAPTCPMQSDGGLTYTEPSVIIAGQPEGLEDVPVRVHDACFTSEVRWPTNMLCFCLAWV